MTKANKIATQAERQDTVLEGVAQSLGKADAVNVNLVTRGRCCQVDIRVQDGDVVRFAKFKVADMGDSIDWASQIAAALTGLAREKGALSTDEEFGFDRVDMTSSAIWNFSKNPVLDLGDVEDVDILLVDGEIPEGVVITTIKIPDSVDGWKALIERLTKRVLWWLTT